MNFYDYMTVALFALAMIFSVPLLGSLGGLLFVCTGFIVLAMWIISCKIIKEVKG